MFDGIPATRPRTRRCPYTGKPLQTTGIAPRNPKPYSIPTGAPPVAQQLAGQVRSSSGVTYGLPRPGGGPALMPKGFISKRAAHPSRPVPAEALPTAAAEPLIAVPEGSPVSIRDRLLANLIEISTMDGVLPTRAAMRHRYGSHIYGALRYLQANGHLRLWYGPRNTDVSGEMIIKVTGQDRELRTPGAPSHIRL